MINVAVIWANLGPYHFARARALCQVPGLAPVFVELAAQERLHPWEMDKGILSARVITLMDAVYEQCPPYELTRRLTAQLSALAPDVVVVAGYGEVPMRAAARWSKAHGKASIVMFESTQWDHPRKWWKEWPKSLFIRRYFDAGFTGGLSHTQYLHALGMPWERIWEKLSVVDNDYFANASAAARDKAVDLRRRYHLPERYFLYIGRFAPEKNLLRLLEAYQEYRLASDDPWGLVLVGDGLQNAELLQRAAALQLKDVVWAGFQQVQELPVYYGLSSCFVLPSTMEPWGLVVNEAMACGVPIVASKRCGCVLDLVKDGENGFTFSPEDVPALARNLAQVASLSEAQRTALGQRSREIIAGYTLDVWAQQLAACVRATIARHPRKVKA